MALSGEITAFLDILRTEQGDDAALPVFALVNFPSEKTDFDEGDSVRTYLTARNEGTQFIYMKRRLNAVSFYLAKNEEYGVYPRPDALIDGLPANATREQVRAMFGEREAGRKAWDRFQVGENFIHFTYDENDTVTQIGIMAETPK